MSRVAKKLTALEARTKPPGRYADGNGLWLLVRPNLARYWMFRYRTPLGRLREMGIGPAANYTLAEAREIALERWKRVKAGGDPIDEKRATRAQAKAEAQKATIATITFETVARGYIANHTPGWKNPKHRAQWRSTLETYVYPTIGKLSVAEIETGHVMAVLSPIWTTKPETATRVRGRIESVLDFAKVRGWRTGENPARWRGHLDHLLAPRAKVAKVEHHAALPWPEINNFLVALRHREGVAAKALQFVILTAARTSEALGATWGEIDMATAIWTVPAARMKAGREHRVPLSAPALALLADMATLRGTGEYIFPSQAPDRPLSNMALLMVLRRMGRGDLTAHGFRSTFRDWAGEATSYPSEVAEAALAHTVGDKTVAAYARGDLFDKRRALMTAWAEYCERPAPEAGDVVVPMRRA